MLVVAKAKEGYVNPIPISKLTGGNQKEFTIVV
jgi:hypothetical protein